MQDVRGPHLVLSLGTDDGVSVGQEVSVLQYGAEVARARVVKADAHSSVATVYLAKPDALVYKLDTVRLSAAPGAAPPEPGAELKPVEPGTERLPGVPGVQSGPPGGWMNIIPRASWTYGALSLLATDGLVTGFAAREFHGDQLFTRGEVATLISGALKERERLGDQATRRSTAILATLARLYARELTFLLGRDCTDRTPLLPEQPGLWVSGHLRPIWETGEGDALLPMFQADATLDLGRGIIAAATVTNQHREWQNAGRAFPYLDRWFIQGSALGFNITLGKEYFRYGPGYTGSLMWGEDAPAIPMLRMDRDLRLPLLGRWRLQQMSGTYREDAGRRYVGLRTLQRSFGRRFTFGWVESYKADTSPNITIGFLPYLAYQQLFLNGAKGINRINVQEGFDFGYHLPSLELYSELFIDDLTAPGFIGSQGSVPRKLGWMVGARFPHLLGDQHTDFRVEWVGTDRNTYLHRNPSISLYERGLPIGHSVGPNARSLFLRANHRVGGRLEFTAAYQTIRQANAGIPNVASLTELTLAGAYDLGRSRSVALRVSPRSVRDLTGRTSDTQVQLLADYSF
ncbi:MAG TPA: capsule assembly Wzi family protein [Armatimonadota bacterium]